MWSESTLTKTLNCTKILPVSESLSSMHIEASRQSYITSMALIASNNISAEQLIIGTSKGIILIVKAKEV